MPKRLFLLLIGATALSGAAGTPGARLPDSYRYARELLPTVVSMTGRIVLGSVLERKPPQYVAVATGKDEYIYQLKDKIFIRCIKDRYETPAWRICGDFAVVRVELMDDSMKTIPPIMAWHMVYREDRWQKLVEDEGGHFLRESFTPAELPPYAVHCFERARNRDDL